MRLGRSFSCSCYASHVGKICARIRASKFSTDARARAWASSSLQRSCASPVLSSMSQDAATTSGQAGDTVEELKRQVADLQDQVRQSLTELTACRTCVSPIRICGTKYCVGASDAGNPACSPDVPGTLVQCVLLCSLLGSDVAAAAMWSSSSTSRSSPSPYRNRYWCYSNHTTAFSCFSAGRGPEA